MINPNSNIACNLFRDCKSNFSPCLLHGGWMCQETRDENPHWIELFNYFIIFKVKILLETIF
jgi:hypothetical protein